MSNEEKTPLELKAYLAQWHEIAERTRRQVESFRNSLESVQKWIQPFVDAQQNLLRNVESIIANQESWRQVAKQAIDFQKAIQASISPAFSELQKAFRALPARTREALLLLGQQGWYLDPEMSLPDLWQLKNALAQGNTIEAEEALVEYFEGRLAKIEDSITSKFPHRCHLIQLAFSAHRRDEYALSIPVLLAQADGICKDTVDQYFFLKQDKKPRTAIYVAQIAADTYEAALLSPLAEALPIGTSGKERAEDSTMLNRHAVLHGESLDYGSKINSLKAISLVNYVTWVLPINSLGEMGSERISE